MVLIGTLNCEYRKIKIAARNINNLRYADETTLMAETEEELKSLLMTVSSHGRGLGPRDALKKDSRGLCRGAVGNPRFPRLLPGTLGNFPA